MRGEVLYNILTEFGVFIKQVRLIEMSFSETYSKVCRGKIFRMDFLFGMARNKEMLYCHCFSTLLQKMPSGRFKKMKSWV
jgi:hypothetical protein